MESSENHTAELDEKIDKQEFNETDKVIIEDGHVFDFRSNDKDSTRDTENQNTGLVNDNEISTSAVSNHDHNPKSIISNKDSGLYKEIKKFAVYFHEACEYHDIPDHPECPSRVRHIVKRIKEKLSSQIEFRKSSLALDEHISLFHDQALIDKIKSLVSKSEQDFRKNKKKSYVKVDMGDTQLMWKSREAIYRAVGSVINAVDDIFSSDESKRIDSCFCCIRPPGHHAEPKTSCGFCFYNNVAIGVKYAQKKYGVGKVAVLDFDVHHGNGTEEGFKDDGSVFYGSTHEKDNFPGTGKDPSPFIGDEALNDIDRRIVNRTLNRGPSSKSEFKIKWQEILNEMLRFKPEMIFISAGFDAHDEDPLSWCELDEQDYAWITKEILKYCVLISPESPIPVISVLEGGYDMEAISESSVVHIQMFLEGYPSIANIEIDESGSFHNGDEVKALSQYLDEIL